MTTTTLIVPDVQYPYHDALALKKLISVASDLQPDRIIQIGDGIDFPQVSRWSKGTAGEYAPTLQKHIDGFRSDVLAGFRESSPGSEMLWIEGNHDSRLRDFVRQYAAPLGSLRNLEIKNLFELDDLDIRYESGPVRVGTNTDAVHGHESGAYAASPQAWQNKFIKRYGSEKNVIFGHTHQPFLITHATGYGGNVRPWFHMNVGSIMDPNHAKYVKDGAVSWTMSFGVLRDDSKRVWPELVTMHNRQFWFEGKKY